MLVKGISDSESRKQQITAPDPEDYDTKAHHAKMPKGHDHSQWTSHGIEAVKLINLKPTPPYLPYIPDYARHRNQNQDYVSSFLTSRALCGPSDLIDMSRLMIPTKPSGI